MMSFRSEVFSLCNRIKRNTETNQLQELIKSLNVYMEGQELPNRSSFGYISRHSNNQFYGYLFTDENITAYKQDALFQDLIGLQEDERTILQRGQATINLVISECLGDIESIYPALVKVLNPYSRFKPIKNITADPFLKSEDVAKVCQAFKETACYKNLINSRMSELIKKLPETQLFQLCEIMNRDIMQNPYNIVSSDIKSLALQYANNSDLPQNLLFRDACLMIALREMLRIASQLVFTALIGGDLIILNDDNIIQIEKNESNIINKFMTVLIQDVPIHNGIDIVGGVVLIDCHPNDDYYIHEFGFVKSETLSMSQDTGITTKLSFSILDESLNPIFNLTN